MTKRQLMVIGGVVGLIVFGAVAWYLASPLFLNDRVDEAFPFEVPSEAEVTAMSMDERMELEAEFETAVPDEAELAELNDEEVAKVEEMVQEAAEVVMMDHEMEEEMPEVADEWAVFGTGNFVGADDFHLGAGVATIYQLDDEQVLRFEDFDVTNGPDLHVILSKHPNPSNRDELGTDYLHLEALKGNQGNQNYEISAGTDLSEYQSVVIYCMPFHVVFATATLN